MEITIFKHGRTIGPHDRESVAEMLARGDVSMSDWARSEGVDDWAPLSRFFPASSKATRFETALQVGREWPRKGWAAIHLDPLRVGAACLLGGCALVILGKWTFAFFVPAFVAAVFAGATLLTRRQFLSGTLLSLGAVVLPAAFLMAGSDHPNIRRSIEFFESPFIESVIPAKPAGPAKPTPQARYLGLALPQPVRPTPMPKPVPPI